MIRARKRQLKKIYLRKRHTSKDAEGIVTEYFDDGVSFEADVSASTGSVQAMMYGEKAQYMRNIVVWGDIELNEKDGLCINVKRDEEPDYQISAIRKHTFFRVLEVEMRLNRDAYRGDR